MSDRADLVIAHSTTGVRGPGLWDEVCSPKIQWRSLLALADLFVINRPHTRGGEGKDDHGNVDNVECVLDRER